MLSSSLPIQPYADMFVDSSWWSLEQHFHLKNKYLTSRRENFLIMVCANFFDEDDDDIMLFVTCPELLAKAKTIRGATHLETVKDSISQIKRNFAAQLWNCFPLARDGSWRAILSYEFQGHRGASFSRRVRQRDNSTSKQRKEIETFLRN